MELITKVQMHNKAKVFQDIEVVLQTTYFPGYLYEVFYSPKNSELKCMKDYFENWISAEDYFKQVVGQMFVDGYR